MSAVGKAWDGPEKGWGRKGKGKAGDGKGKAVVVPFQFKET